MEAGCGYLEDQAVGVHRPTSTERVIWGKAPGDDHEASLHEAIEAASHAGLRELGPDGEPVDCPDGGHLSKDLRFEDGDPAVEDHLKEGSSVDARHRRTTT